MINKCLQKLRNLFEYYYFFDSQKKIQEIKKSFFFNFHDDEIADEIKQKTFTIATRCSFYKK